MDEIRMVYNRFEYRCQYLERLGYRREGYAYRYGHDLVPLEFCRDASIQEWTDSIYLPLKSAQ